MKLRKLGKLKSALLATTATAALTITGCGYDDGPDSPLAPNSIETAKAPTMIGANSAGDANGSGLEIHGELPPGISRADLEARLADLQETFESEVTTRERVVQSNQGATRPGMHRITGDSVNKSGDRYEVVLTLQAPNPPGNSDSRLITERLRADGQFARVGTTNIGASVVNWASTAVRHNGTTHRFEPGWYVFWMLAQNCVDGHCAFSRPSVKVIEIEEEEEEEEELPPDPPSLVGWSTNNWMCSNTECTAQGSITLRNVVRSHFDVRYKDDSASGTHRAPRSTKQSTYRSCQWMGQSGSASRYGCGKGGTSWHCASAEPLTGARSGRGATGRRQQPNAGRADSQRTRGGRTARRPAKRDPRQRRDRPLEDLLGPALGPRRVAGARLPHRRHRHHLGLLPELQGIRVALPDRQTPLHRGRRQRTAVRVHAASAVAGGMDDLGLRGQRPRRGGLHGGAGAELGGCAAENPSGYL